MDPGLPQGSLWKWPLSACLDDCLTSTGLFVIFLFLPRVRAGNQALSTAGLHSCPWAAPTCTRRLPARQCQAVCCLSGRPGSRCSCLVCGGRACGWAMGAGILCGSLPGHWALQEGQGHSMGEARGTLSWSLPSETSPARPSKVGGGHRGPCLEEATARPLCGISGIHWAASWKGLSSAWGGQWVSNVTRWSEHSGWGVSVLQEGGLPCLVLAHISSRM